MKAHLLSTALPIKSGRPQTADCGKALTVADIVFLWDEAAMGEGLKYGKNVCDKCQLADSGPRKRILVYGITERTNADDDQA